MRFAFILVESPFIYDCLRSRVFLDRELQCSVETVSQLVYLMTSLVRLPQSEVFFIVSSFQGDANDFFFQFGGQAFQALTRTLQSPFLSFSSLYACIQLSHLGNEETLIG